MSSNPYAHFAFGIQIEPYEQRRRGPEREYLDFEEDLAGHLGVRKPSEPWSADSTEWLAYREAREKVLDDFGEMSLELDGYVSVSDGRVFLCTKVYSTCCWDVVDLTSAEFQVDPEWLPKLQRVIAALDMTPIGDFGWKLFASYG